MFKFMFAIFTLVIRAKQNFTVFTIIPVLCFSFFPCHLITIIYRTGSGSSFGICSIHLLFLGGFLGFLGFRLPIFLFCKIFQNILWAEKGVACQFDFS